MKTQIVYETNADYEATYRKLAESQVIVAEKTEKGLIWFTVKGTKTVFTLSPYGRLQVKWNNPEEKKVLLKIIKTLIAPKQGQKFRMKPTGQQPFIRYPPPPNFKLWWCDEETEYHKQTAKRTSETLTHRRQLSLGLEAILAEDWYLYRYQETSGERARWKDKIEREGIRLKEFVIEHLRSDYPDTYDKLKRWRKLKEALLKEGNSVHDVDEAVARTFFGEFPRSDERRNLLVQGIAVYRALRSDIELINLKIEAGKSLEGTCRLCRE